jgi:hypothetical protein
LTAALEGGQLFSRASDIEQDETLKRLRAATEDDVRSACADAYVNLGDKSAAELLEFFNRMLDVLVGEEEPGAPEPGA